MHPDDSPIIHPTLGRTAPDLFAVQEAPPGPGRVKIAWDAKLGARRHRMGTDLGTSRPRRDRNAFALTRVLNLYAAQAS